MKIDKEEDTGFYFRFVYVFLSLSANKEISMDSKKRVVKCR